MSKAKDEGKRQNILQAATKIFGSKGFKATKISEIAKEAGVADGTIYLYFQNKEDLLSAVFEFNMDRLILLTLEAMKKLTHPLQKLRSFIETHLKYIGEHRDLSRVFQVELHQNNNHQDEKNNQKFHEYLEILNQILKQGQDLGWIRNDINVEILKRVLFGSLSELAVNFSLNSNATPPVTQSAGQVFQIITEGLKTPQSANKSLGDQTSLSAA